MKGSFIGTYTLYDWVDWCIVPQLCTLHMHEYSHHHLRSPSRGGDDHTTSVHDNERQKLIEMEKLASKKRQAQSWRRIFMLVINHPNMTVMNPSIHPSLLVIMWIYVNWVWYGYGMIGIGNYHS